MSKLQEKEIGRKTVFEGRLLKVRVDTVLLPSGKQSTREVVEHPGAVAIIALTNDGEIILVRQYRQPTGQVLLEVPAGCLNPGEEGLSAARRELQEETGYYAKHIEKVWEGYVAPGYSSEMIQYYLAQDLTLLTTHTDEDEFVEVDLVDLELALDLCKTGKIKDNKTMIAVMLAGKRGGYA